MFDHSYATGSLSAFSKMFCCVSVHILAAGHQFKFNLMFGRVFGHILDVDHTFDFFLNVWSCLAVGLLFLRVVVYLFE